MVSNENFPRLVHLYKDMIFRLAYSYTKNHFDADDITQNVLVQLYSPFKKLACTRDSQSVQKSF